MAPRAAGVTKMGPCLAPEGAGAAARPESRYGILGQLFPIWLRERRRGRRKRAPVALGLISPTAAGAFHATNRPRPRPFRIRPPRCTPARAGRPPRRAARRDALRSQQHGGAPRWRGAAP